MRKIKKRNLRINPVIFAAIIVGMILLGAITCQTFLQNYENYKTSHALSNIPVVHANIPVQYMPAVFAYITQPLQPTPQIVNQFLSRGGSKIVVFDRD